LGLLPLSLNPSRAPRDATLFLPTL
jgi:hypothetical protein